MKRLLLAALLLSGCRFRTEQQQVLPWLKVRRIHTGFGGFGDSTTVRYSSRVFGLWWHVDAWSADPLGEDAAVVRNEKGAGILRRGHVRVANVCALLNAYSVPRRVAAVDCSEPLGFDSNGVVRMRIRRTPVSGPEETYEVEATGQGRFIHARASVAFYDHFGVPYVLIMNGDAARDYRRMPTGCALVPAGPRREAPIEGPADMTFDQCRRAESWAAVLGRPLSPG